MSDGQWAIGIGHGGLGFEQRTSSAGTADHQTELNTLLDILLAANLNLPARGPELAQVTFFWSMGQQCSIRGSIPR